MLLFCVSLLLFALLKRLVFEFFFYQQEKTRVNNTIRSKAKHLGGSGGIWGSGGSRGRRRGGEDGITVEAAHLSVEIEAGVAEGDGDEILVRKLLDGVVGEAAPAVPAEEERHGEHPESERIGSQRLFLVPRSRSCFFFPFAGPHHFFLNDGCWRLVGGLNRDNIIIKKR